MLRKTCYPLARSLMRSCYQQRTSHYSTIASREPTNDSDTVPRNVSDLSKPAHVQLPKRNPFMKSMFMGTVDTELLSFPESLNREEQSRLEQHKQEVEKLLGNDGTASIGLYGLQGPLEHAGKQFTETELAYISELISDDRAKAMVIQEHNAIVKLLSHLGSDEAKGKYLAKLCAGEIVATYAMYEVQSSRQTMFSTVATQDVTTDCWTLSGSKVFLRNSEADPGLLLVVASTKDLDKLNKEDGTLGVFLVDTNAPGVTITHSALGSKGLSRATVDFKEVAVPDADIIGLEHGSSVVLSKFLSATRVQSSVVRVALLKKVLNSLTDFCINGKTCTGEIMDLEIVRQQLARMASVIYAAESMIYMTSSLIDDFDGQDVEMEAAITKVFTTENLLKFASLPLQLLGPQALGSELSFETLYNDALKLFVGDESVDSVNFFIALAGLQYTGIHSFETIKKDRNPAMNPSHVISKLFEKTSIANPKKFADLQQFFHPSLDPAAHWIEFSIVRLKLATQHVLSRYGIEVVERHIELIRLARMATLIYAMTSTASRASRSYCIGLRNAAHEVHLANMFCREAHETVRQLAVELEQGPYITSDDDYNGIARHLVREKRYFFEHPLARNF